jgi:hypothetical protein
VPGRVAAASPISSVTRTSVKSARRSCNAAGKLPTRSSVRTVSIKPIVEVHMGISGDRAKNSRGSLAYWRPVTKVTKAGASR